MEHNEVYIPNTTTKVFGMDGLWVLHGHTSGLNLFQ